MATRSTSLNGFVGGSGVKDSNIPIGHLDYSYISKCENPKDLQEIIKVLRLGSEGFYPDLVEFAENKLRELDPKSHVLRKDNPAQRYGDLDEESKKAVTEDLQDWMNKMNNVDTKLTNEKSEMVNGEPLPPIRSAMKTTKIETDVKVTKMDTLKEKKSVKPRDYKEWDKFDTEKELAEVDKKEASSQVKDSKNKKDTKNKTMFETKPIITKDLKPEERLLRAMREKEKGNEAFKAMDYEEAIVYYTNSLEYSPIAASYNNRAAAELKTEQYTYVIDDCGKVLELEPKNIKAYLRRSMAYRARKLYKEAKNDLQQLLSLDPNNRRAKQLLGEVEEIEKKTVEVEEPTKCETFDNLSKEDGNKLSHKKDQPMIIELDSTETPSDKQPKGKGTGEEISEDIKSKQKGQRLKIVEVESTEDPDVKVSPPVNEETGSKTLGNTKSKKNGQRLKIEEIDTVASGSDVKKPTPEGTGKESKVNAGSYNEKEAAEASVKPGASGVSNEDPAKDAGISAKDSASVSGETEAGSSADVVKEGDSVATATTTHDTFVKPDLVPAMQEAKVVLEIPDKVKSLTKEGNELYRIGHYADALKKFSKCVDHLWNDRVAYSSAVSSLLNNKAACYVKMGDCKQCVKECNESLALIGDNVRVLIRRGIAYETMEKYAEAFRDFNRVRLLDGSNQVARQHCSRVIKHLEMLHGKSWRKEIFEMNNSSTPQPFLDTDKNKKTTADTIPPGSKETEKTSSPAQVDPQKEANPKAVPTKRSPDCEIKVNHKEEFERKKQEQYLRLKESGKTLVKQGKHREAINHYTDCIKLCPEEVIGYTNRALCHLQLKNHELAEADCNAALNIQADNIKALFRRAKARKQMKRYRESSKDLITMLKLDVKNAHAQTELNEVLEFLKQEKRETEKSTASKRKRIVVEDVEGDENKTSTPVVTGTNISELEKNEESELVEEEVVQQSGSEGKKSVPIKEVSPPVTTGTKSSTAKRKAQPKEVEKEIIKDSTISGTNVSELEKNERSKVVKEEARQQSGGENIAKGKRSVRVKVVSPPATTSTKSYLANRKKQAKVVKKKIVQDLTKTVSDVEVATTVAKDTANISVSEKIDASKVVKKECLQPSCSDNVGKEQNKMPIKHNVKTAFQFLQTWKDVKKKDTAEYLSILKQVNLADLLKVIGNKLDADMITTMLQALQLELKSKGDLKFVYNFLQRLHCVERFEINLMFQSKAEKQALSDLFDGMMQQRKQTTDIRTEDLAKLRKRYLV